MDSPVVVKVERDVDIQEQLEARESQVRALQSRVELLEDRIRQTDRWIMEKERELQSELCCLRRSKRARRAA